MNTAIIPAQPTMPALVTDDSAAVIARQFAIVHHQLSTAPGKGGSMYRAKNYASALNDLQHFMTSNGHTLPDRSTLELWKTNMQSRGLTERTVNARLSAARQLLNGMADNVPGIELKTMLRDWAKVESVPLPVVQDKVEEDYGLRLTIGSLQTMISSIDTSHIKGIRDKALISVMAGAGLRVSEVVKLSMRDMFLSEDSKGVQCIRVKKGKGNKARLVPLPTWVKTAVQAYTDALGLLPLMYPDAPIFRQVKPIPGKSFVDIGLPLSERGAQRAVNAYEAEYNGQMVQVNAHDLRRTYAKLCRDAGMEWEDLRDNLGHASVMTTEKYVGAALNLKKRKPKWAIEV